MKEILKYLRQTQSFSQEDVAQAIGLSRQSYIKYESGAVVPSDKIVTKLAAVYGVEKEVIYANKIPQIPMTLQQAVQCEIPAHGGELKLASPNTAAFSGTRYDTNVYDVYFDGNTLRLTDESDSHFLEGQRFKLVPVDSADAVARKKRAWETIESITAHKKPYHKAPDDDPYYKEALYEALMEKYDTLN